jgi:hypothetical protein
LLLLRRWLWLLLLLLLWLLWLRFSGAHGSAG